MFVRSRKAQDQKVLSKAIPFLWWYAYFHVIQMFCALQITDHMEYMGTRTRHYQSPAVAQGQSSYYKRGDNITSLSKIGSKPITESTDCYQIMSQWQCVKRRLQKMSTEEEGWRVKRQSGERREGRSCKGNKSWIRENGKFAVIMELLHVQHICMVDIQALRNQPGEDKCSTNRTGPVSHLPRTLESVYIVRQLNMHTDANIYMQISKAQSPHILVFDREFGSTFDT